MLANEGREEGRDRGGRGLGEWRVCGRSCDGGWSGVGGRDGRTLFGERRASGRGGGCSGVWWWWWLWSMLEGEGREEGEARARGAGQTESRSES